MLVPSNPALSLNRGATKLVLTNMEASQCQTINLPVFSLPFKVKSPSQYRNAQVQFEVSKLGMVRTAGAPTLERAAHREPYLAAPRRK